MVEIFLAIVYFFKESISGNLDLFYILSAFLFIRLTFLRKKIVVESWKWFIPLAFYGLIQMIILKDLNFIRLIVNLSKIFLCINLFVEVKYNFHKINMQKFIKCISLLFIISLPMGLIFRNQLLWRLNDMVNIYAKVRLRLLYFEPSELAFQVSIIVIFLLYYLVLYKKEKYQILFASACLIYLLLLSSGVGGIYTLILSVFVLFLLYYSNKISVKKMLYLYLFLCIAGVGLFIFINGKNDLFLRLIDIATGKDGSFTYRFFIGYDIMHSALINSNWIGSGFGNLNTDSFRNLYSSLGLVDVIANSFMYFITEGGVFAIGFLITFHCCLIKNIDKNSMVLKIPLLLFIFIYQIFGGYFTNPMNWIIYGVIASLNESFKEKELVEY